MTSVPNCSSLDAHGLEVREKIDQSVLVPLIGRQSAIKALLTLILLLEKVVTAVALHGDFAASRASNTLLCAAV